MTIVNTLPDNAHLFASVLDEIKPPSIVSTIAGFDTIMVISENEEDAKRVEEFLHHPTEVSLLIRARIPNMECVFLFSIFSLLNKPLHSLQNTSFYSIFQHLD